MNYVSDCVCVSHFASGEKGHYNSNMQPKTCYGLILNCRTYFVIICRPCLFWTHCHFCSNFLILHCIQIAWVEWNWNRLKTKSTAFKRRASAQAHASEQIHVYNIVLHNWRLDKKRQRKKIRRKAGEIVSFHIR